MHLSCLLVVSPPQMTLRLAAANAVQLAADLYFPDGRSALHKKMVARQRIFVLRSRCC